MHIGISAILVLLQIMHQGFSTQSLLSAILPEPFPDIFPKDPLADIPLKLLLPSLRLFDFLDLLFFEESLSLPLTLIEATANCAMLLRQKGQTGGEEHAMLGLGLLWQHSANVQ